ncbi:hypothetical protein ATANTOWER_025032 [Ataeniobius toweri]|uniref:Uncharacterized protein n=1 Tax=Ataeniobius toweri TaxID=208326 RepID=A0ABU7CFK4_9TELE|nr:hypothetical protein [Ataeniobius toweri]
MTSRVTETLLEYSVCQKHYQIAQACTQSLDWACVDGLEASEGTMRVPNRGALLATYFCGGCMADLGRCNMSGCLGLLLPSIAGLPALCCSGAVDCRPSTVVATPQNVHFHVTNSHSHTLTQHKHTYFYTYAHLSTEHRLLQLAAEWRLVRRFTHTVQ